MFTCGDCADVECAGKSNPQDSACDAFTREYEEMKVSEEHYDNLKTLKDEVLLLRIDLNNALSDIEELQQIISALASTMAREIEATSLSE